MAAPDLAPQSQAPPPTGPRGGSGIEAWGRRFGWMVAVAVSVLALLLSGIALANSGGHDHHGFRGGEMRFGGPRFGDHDGYRGAQGGSGSGTSTTPGGTGQEFPAPVGPPSQ